MGFKKIFFGWGIFMCFIMLNCQHSPVDSTKQLGSISLQLDKTNIPSEIKLITISLSRSGFKDIVKDFVITDSSLTARFDSLAAGIWLLQADAKDSMDQIIFSGSTNVFVEAGKITRVILRLEEVNGSLEVTIIWPGSKLKLVRDFDDGQLPNWGGNALMENENGTLKLTSTASISWRWEIFDHGDIGFFTKGTLEFDVKFGKQGYFFDLRGHSKSVNDINWGPKVDFREGKILNSQPGEFVDTGSRYIPNDWYHIRAIFDNQSGEKGKFKLYLQNITRSEPEFFVGELDYYASNGPLVDIVQFSFGLRTLDKVPQTSFFIDNVKLMVE